jgi:hypothetical protein
LSDNKWLGRESNSLYQKNIMGAGKVVVGGFYVNLSEGQPRNDDGCLATMKKGK